MTTVPKNDNGQKRRSTCPSEAEGPIVGTKEDYVATITLSSQSPLIEPTGTSGVSRDRNTSFESLKHTLSSRGGRESLYALQTGQAIGVIDVLEQGSREDSSLCAYHQKRFSMTLRKMCLKHKRLPPSYAITDELRRIGDYPYGGGGSADVWRGTYRGSQVAIKVLRANSKNLASLEKRFCHEVILWKQFKHPNLLQLVGAKFSLPTLVMVSEWMEHGTIMDFVTVFPETNRLKLLADVARGVKYIHDWPSVHADLKSSNILIDSNRTARIADFGLTSLLRHPSISISVTPPLGGGTYRWLAPELLDGELRPSRESDIYALGMVIYEVFAHEQPFSHVSPCAALTLALTGERPSRPTNRGILGLSEDIWMLMERCWARVPSTRPQATDILSPLETASHNWLPPAFESIGDPSLGCPIDQSSSTARSTDTVSETMFGTIGGVAVGPHEAEKSLPMSSGEGRTTATVEDTPPLTLLTCLRFLWNFSLFSWLL